jgi:hypothetical protein
LIQSGTRSLSEILDISQSGLGHNTSLIVITPDVSGRWLESLLAVRRLEVVPTVLIFDQSTFGGDNYVDGLVQDLSQLGIVHDVIPKSLLDQDEIRPGQEGHLEWRVTPLGRAVPDFEPEKLIWRNLN